MTHPTITTQSIHGSRAHPRVHAHVQVLVEAGITVLTLDVTTLEASVDQVKALCELAMKLGVRMFGCCQSEIPDDTFLVFRGYSNLHFLKTASRFDWDLSYAINSALQTESWDYLVSPYVEFQTRFALPGEDDSDDGAGDFDWNLSGSASSLSLGSLGDLDDLDGSDGGYIDI